MTRHIPYAEQQKRDKGRGFQDGLNGKSHQSHGEAYMQGFHQGKLRRESEQKLRRQTGKR